MPDLEMPYDELETRVRLDFMAAAQTRQYVENRKIDYYELYRSYRSDVSGGGQTETTSGNGRGPFNWSRLSIPIVYINVEGFISRLAPEAPTPTVIPRTVDSVPYAQAKQLRIQRDLDDQNWQEITVEGVKDMLILGDGITKTTWRPAPKGSRRSGCPLVTHVPWTDFFVSPEAVRMDDAEVLYHRTWHSRRSLDELAKMTDPSGKLLYENVEELNWTATRDTIDETYQRRRELSGQDQPSRGSAEADEIAIIEAWNIDGTVTTFGWGGSQVVILRHVANTYVDYYGDPVRPFVSFSNTPDPESPYAISDAEMVEDCQREAQVIVNQSIDATARNIMNPTFFNQNRTTMSSVQAALNTPGGAAGVDGPPQEAVYQPPAVSLPADSEAILNRIFQVSQLISGISDEGAPFEGPRPGDDDGATGAWIRSQDRNRRVQYKLMLLAIAVRKIARRIDYIDRQFRKGEDVVVPVPSGYRTPDGSLGIKLNKAGNAAVVSSKANARGLEYDIKIDAGSLEAPFAGEQAVRANQLAQSLALPMLAPYVNWPEVGRILADASNFDSDRILVPNPEQVAAMQAAGPGLPGQPGAGGQPGVSGMPGAPMMPGAPLAVGAPPGQMPPGAMPVGQPVPVSVSGEGMPPPPTPGAAPVGQVPVGQPVPVEGQPAGAVEGQATAGSSLVPYTGPGVGGPDIPGQVPVGAPQEMSGDQGLGDLVNQILGQPVAGPSPDEMMSGMQAPATMPGGVDTSGLGPPAVVHLTPGAIEVNVHQDAQDAPQVDVYVTVPPPRRSRKIITLPDGKQAVLEEIPIPEEAPAP